MQQPRQSHIRWRSRLQGCVSFLFACAIALSSLISPAYATGVWELPQPTSEEPLFIFDEGDVLSRATEGRLSQTAQKLAQQKGFNVHLITVQRLDYGETATDLAQQILEEWYPEAPDRANQAILVVDTLTNTAALKLGDALKSVVPEDTTTSIVQETLAYPLRQNRYNQAISDASDRLITVLSGKPDPGPPQMTENTANVESTFATAEETEATRTSSTIWVVVLLVAATAIPMATYYFYLYLQSRA